MCMNANEASEVPFVRAVGINDSGEALSFLATDQLKDVVRFCTLPSHHGVVGVDTTFNCGDFYVTLTTFPYLVLTNSQGKSPYFLGPALVHQRKLATSYAFLAQNMVNLELKLNSFGTIRSAPTDASYRYIHVVTAFSLHVFTPQK